MTGEETKAKTTHITDGLHYYGEDLKEVFTEPVDEAWQFVRVNDKDYPRKCVRIRDDDVFISVACVRTELDGCSEPVEVEQINAGLSDCRFFYVVDSEGHPIEWKRKK